MRNVLQKLRVNETQQISHFSSILESGFTRITQGALILFKINVTPFYALRFLQIATCANGHEAFFSYVYLEPYLWPLRKEKVTYEIVFSFFFSDYARMTYVSVTHTDGSPTRDLGQNGQSSYLSAICTAVVEIVFSKYLQNPLH